MPVILANNIIIPPNSFNLFTVSGTLPLNNVPLEFSGSALGAIQKKKLLVKSVKIYYSLKRENPGDADNLYWVANKIVANALGEVTGLEISVAERIIPRDSICWKNVNVTPRLLINGKNILFNVQVAHPMVDEDNLLLLISDPVESIKLYIPDFTLPKDHTGATTISKINVAAEIGVYLL